MSKLYTVATSYTLKQYASCNRDCVENQCNKLFRACHETPRHAERSSIISPNRDLVTFLDNHFIPKRCGFSKWYNFYAATQQLSEPYTQLAASLRVLLVVGRSPKFRQRVVPKGNVQLLDSGRQIGFLCKMLQQIRLEANPT